MEYVALVVSIPSLEPRNPRPDRHMCRCDAVAPDHSTLPGLGSLVGSMGLEGFRLGQ